MPGRGQVGAEQWCGWIRRRGVKPGHWQQVVSADSEADCRALLEHARYQEQPCAGWCVCEWVTLRRGQHPSSLRESARRPRGIPA
jgi:hypothetical protein